MTDKRIPTLPVTDPKRNSGFAVASHGRIYVETVSPTERAAKVNWLVTRRGFMVLQTHSDADIEHMWKVHREANETVVPVEIRIIRQ